MRERFVFTTHTPVPAGNETYGVDELLAAYDDLPDRLGITPDELVAPVPLAAGRLGRVARDDAARDQAQPHAQRRQPSCTARSRARMWLPMFPGRAPDDVPIDHVTNGAHLPTFLSKPFAELYDRYLGEEWWTRAADPATWEPVREIPDARGVGGARRGADGARSSGRAGRA